MAQQDQPAPATQQEGASTSTPRLGVFDWLRVLWRVRARIFQDNIGLIAAGVAFYSLLALFPGITALVALAGLAADPAILVPNIAPMLEPLPDAAANIIGGQVSAIATAGTDDLSLAVIAGLVLALYSSSRGVTNLMAGLNIAYGERESRSFLVQKFVTVALTFGGLIAILVAVSIVAILPAVLGVLDSLGLLNEWKFWQTVADIARWPILFVLGVALFGLLYRFGPSRSHTRSRLLGTGAVAACSLWVLASVGFAWYVQNFGAYNETFGALGGVIVLLMWLWLSAYVALFGAVLESEMHAQVARNAAHRADPRF